MDRRTGCDTGQETSPPFHQRICRARSWSINHDRFSLPWPAPDALFGGLALAGGHDRHVDLEALLREADLVGLFQYTSCGRIVGRFGRHRRLPEGGQSQSRQCSGDQHPAQEIGVRGHRGHPGSRVPAGPADGTGIAKHSEIE
jgi:hypothetical protein